MSAIWDEAVNLSKSGATMINAVGLVLSRQRAEARLGISFLVVGFVFQAVPFFTGGAWDFEGWEAVVGIVVGLAPVVIGWIAYKVYVPWDTERGYKGRVLSTAEKAERRRTGKAPKGL